MINAGSRIKNAGSCGLICIIIDLKDSAIVKGDGEMSHVLNPTIFEFFLTYSILLSISLLWEKYVRRSLTYSHGVFLSLFIGYMLITLLLTVQPMSTAERSIVTPDAALVNFEPFRMITLQMQSVQGHWLLMWSICLPVPFMFFLGFFAQGRVSFPGLVAMGIMSSVAIELALFLMNGIPQFPKHLFDVDALILNSLGVFSGALLFCWMETKQWMKDCISDTMSAR
ncbi:Glycopeptide antibiotics resistance protein [Sporolactobacillus nakayamae]|uniref:Glycopeptide antibiotics resistance protein n=1 Tax=Sporolactobacillus nakayamae TaxID=269670 RepID=A0A1I2UKK4_9BACL|nr:Glycopeptide antibiotics resistance protein [Sporolactobacillus nakayamae]